MAELTSTKIYGDLQVVRDSLTDTLTVTHGAVINEGGDSGDFRVEADGQTHMLFVDSGEDRVGIAQSTPAYTLDVTGNGRFTSTLLTAAHLSTTDGTVDIGSSGAGYFRHGYFSGTVYSDDSLILNWQTTPQTLDANATGIYTSSKFGFGGETAPSCAIDSNGTIRSTAQVAPTSGAGLEMLYTSGTGYLHAYDRTGVAYDPLYVSGSTLLLRANNAGGSMVTNLELGNGVVNFSGLDASGVAQINFTSNVSQEKLLVENAGAEVYSLYYADSPNTWEWHTGSTIVAQLDFDTGLFRSANDIVAYYSFSDERLKDNITDLGNVSHKLNKIKPVTFNWKDGAVDTRTHYGFIAQQVQPYFPETVTEDLNINDGKDYFRIRYDEFAPILTKAFQEQQLKIKSQDETIKSLEDRIYKLEKVINKTI